LAVKDGLGSGKSQAGVFAAVFHLKGEKIVDNRL